MKKENLRAITDPLFKENPIDPSEIEVHEENVLDEETPPTYNVEEMNHEEKKDVLINWISNAEEYTLDGLITQHLNL